MLERLADFMENQSKLRGKVGAALAYPALMMVIGSVLISVMMVVVVPKVTSIFASLDRALPWYTQLLIGVSRRSSASSQMLGFVLGDASTLTFARSALRDYKDSERGEARRLYAIAGARRRRAPRPRAPSRSSRSAPTRVGVVVGVVAGLGIAAASSPGVATPAGRASGRTASS